MNRTFDAVVETDGQVRLLDQVRLIGPFKASVTLLEDARSLCGESAALSVRSLAVDWDRPEEDAAWAHLQSEQ